MSMTPSLTYPEVPFRSSFTPMINNREQPTISCMIRMVVASTLMRNSVIPNR